MKIVCLIFLIVNSWLYCLGQDNIELRIKEIQMESEKINRELKKFTITKIDVNDLSQEGGILKKYFEGKVLKKATLTLFGETGQSITEYYFLEGNLIFVQEQIETYTGPIEISKGETESTEINKFYFNKQKLIRWIDNDDEIVNNELYIEKEKELIDDLKLIF
jgi:hypothetical protein